MAATGFRRTVWSDRNQRVNPHACIVITEKLATSGGTMLKSSVVAHTSSVLWGAVEITPDLLNRST